MARVFAIFADEKALEQATRGMADADYEVLAPVNDTSAPPGGGLPAAPAVAGATLNPGSPVGVGVPAGAASLVSGPTLEDELHGKGLPEGETRMFADALRSGSHVLIVHRASEGLADRLREAGAAHVSPN
ncbi:MAG: hypothetical protein C4342_01095 [Armatimonadota bacterium]